MEGFAVIIILVLLILLVLPIWVNFQNKWQINELNDEIKKLNFKINNLIHKLDINEQNIPKPQHNTETEPESIEKVVSHSEKMIIPNPIPIVEVEKTETKTIEPEIIEIIEPLAISKSPETNTIKENRAVKKIKFEQFIGEKLVSIVGISILVLGIFFAIKLAIDKNLISNAGKIWIGLISGTLLLSVAHKLSKNFRAFSSVLAGGGIAVFYFSIYESYQTYHLLSQSIAFLCMVFISIFTIILSIYYDKKELALIAILGGFATPFFVSNGSGNYVVLFTYILILNIALFMLSFFKKWSFVNFIAYLFTIIIFGSWFIFEMEPKFAFYKNGFIFSSLFYLVFLGIQLAYNLKNKTIFEYKQIINILSINSLYLFLGLYFVDKLYADKFQGLFVISLAVINFILVFLFYKRQQIDKNLIYLLIALTVSYISLSIPLQMDGNYITLFWTCEFLILYWLGNTSKIPFIKNASILVVLLCLVSLVLDWDNNYFKTNIYALKPILNRAFITGLIVVIGLFLLKKLSNLDQDMYLFWGKLPLNVFKIILNIFMLLTIYFVGYFELGYQTTQFFIDKQWVEIWHFIYSYAFLAVVVYLNRNNENLKLKSALNIIVASSFFAYFFVNWSVKSLVNNIINQEALKSDFNYTLLLPLFAVSLIFLIVNFNKSFLKNNNKTANLLMWPLCFMFVYITSQYMLYWGQVHYYEKGFALSLVSAKVIKVVWPIWWSLIALVLMIIGMKNKYTLLRIMSLVLFTITIIKLFTIDIKNVGQGGKIIAFVILGIILLLVSFLYQKIKSIFIEEHENKN